MKPQAHDYLQKIENYKPGKAKINNSINTVIKLSSNENALGASPKAIKAYKSHDKDLFRYANGSCEDLRKALANKHKISENNKFIIKTPSKQILCVCVMQSIPGTGIVPRRTSCVLGRLQGETVPTFRRADPTT